MTVCLPTLLLCVCASACLGALHDWCPDLREARNNTELHLALAAKRITCGAMVNPPYSIYHEETETWSGFDIELFAEVARRGNFEYEIVKLEVRNEGETYDNILYGAGREVDMLCSWWGETASRKRRNIVFTIPTVDLSIILVTPAPEPVQVPFKERFWVFLEPFSRDLWLVLLFGIVFTALFFFVVDPQLAATSSKEDDKEEGRGEDTGVLAALRRSAHALSELFYQGWVLVTVQDGYKNVSSPWSKLYFMSWTGTVVFLLMAYNAQLTTFLIIQLQSVSSINNLDDLLRSGKPACAMTDVTFVRAFLKSAAPSLKIQKIKSIGEAFPAIREGRCGAALLGKSEVELMIAENEQCDMGTVGSTLNWMTGGFAAAVDSSNCGLFVLRVVDAIKQAINEEGTMEEMWDKYTELPSGCLGEPSTEEKAKRHALSLEAVGGLLIIHAAVVFVASLGFSLQQFLKSRRRPPQTQKEEVLEDKKLQVNCWSPENHSPH